MCRTSVVGSMAGRQTSSDSVGCSACGELGVSRWQAAIHIAAEAGPAGKDGQDGNRVSATTAGEWLVHLGALVERGIRVVCALLPGLSQAGVCVGGYSMTMRCASARARPFVCILHPFEDRL